MKNVVSIITTILFLATLCAAQEAQRVNIGVVTDGPSERYDRFNRQVLSELQALCGNAFQLRLDNAKRRDGAWNLATLNGALESVENDPTVDIVLSMGIASATLASSSTLRKPTFAPLMVRIGSAPETRGSGIVNFNYLETGSGFDAALEQFLGGVPFTRMALLIDALHLETLSSGPSALERIATVRGVTVSFVADSGDGKLLEKIPADAEAVMIAPLPRVSKALQQGLIEGFKARKLPSYSFDAGISAESGALMGERSADDMQRRARQMALNIYEVLRGAKAGDQDVRFELRSPLKINMQTARAIGVSPSFAWLRGVVQLHQYDTDGGERLTLANAAREAVHANLSLVAGMIGLEADQETIGEVRSLLFPQLHAGVGYVRYNGDNVYVENGFYAKTSLAGSLRLEQLLFSERTLAQLEIAKSSHAALEAQQRLLELAVVYRTATAYLGVLNAQERLTIRQEQLELVRANRDLAKGRVETGVSDRSDLYHWESMIASERTRLLEAEAALRRSQDLLNTLMHRPSGASLQLADATLDDPELLISREGMRDLVSDENAYRRLECYFVGDTLQHSPELSLIDAQTQAQQRRLSSDERAYWSPDVAAYGETSRVFDESRVPGAAFSLEDQTNWEAGIALSLPLYEGGARGARSERSRLELQRLRTQRLLSEEELERRIRSDLHALRASYPSISLSQQALEAALKSYELVRQNYAAGTRSMADLLSVQSARLAARQNASDARYRFMGDLMHLQYDGGRFDFFLDDAEKDAAARRLRESVNPTRNTEQGSLP